MGTKWGHGKRISCVICAKIFSAQGKRRTCSDECKDSYLQRRRANRMGKHRTCKFCSGKIDVSRGQSQYCSKECKTKAMFGTRKQLNLRSPYIKNADMILVEGVRSRRSMLHRALQERGVTYKCQECGQDPEWNGRILVLEIDHVDGNPRNNVESNLRYLCPNCHSQCTDTNRPWKNKLP